jgi:hypothetical protein
VGVFGLVSPHRALGRPSPLLLAGSRSLETVLALEPMHSLVVHQPAFPAQQVVGHPPAPVDVLGSDLAETMPELGLLDRDNLAGMPLCAAVLAHHPVEQLFICPVTLLQDRDSPPAARRASKFPSARSFSIAFSSSASARNFLSRAFPFFNCVSCLVSSAFTPP